jgi:transketolase
MRKIDLNLKKFLERKADWARKETLKIHRLAPETRLASSLSAIEIFVVLYYGRILNFHPRDINWQKRDRFIVSKGHGAIALYPILADLGFFEKEKLNKVCRKGSIFGSIPDCSIPGFEAINGSLGHGLGVSCGIALALRAKKINAGVFVMSGDGELYEGANWEAIMFAAHHRLSNLLLIVDNNRISMLDYCKNIIDLCPLQNKFRSFNWETKVTDGHNVGQLYSALSELKSRHSPYPKVLIANTIKGKGVPVLENNPLCHTKSLRCDEIDAILQKG